MKLAINLSDSRNRDSQVVMESARAGRVVRRVDPNGQPVHTIRAIKSTLATDLRALTLDCSPEDLSDVLIAGDPEIDRELFGKQIHETSRVYLNDDNDPAFGVRTREYVYDVKGELKEEREPAIVEGNLNPEKPLRWSGRLLAKKACFSRFAFTNIFQLTHVNGLTYDFLFEIARELEDKASFLFLGAGEKGNQPLVLRRNGTPYRGFLEGRTRERQYMLLLHLTNLELKSLTDEV